MLKDSFNRVHDYLRIAVTDKCNFNCVYCIPVKNCHFLPNDKLMTVDEIYGIAKVFKGLGINKIRLTGGEPLLRPDILTIIERLKSLSVELAMTTNGFYLDKVLDDLISFDIESINVSLDTTDRNKFFDITGKNAFDKIFDNIRLLMDKGLHPKINVVLIKGMNDNEIKYFVNWTKDLPVHIRFIEYMPFEANRWNFNNVVSLDDILNTLQQDDLEIIKLNDKPHSTSKSFQIKDYKGTFAVISTVSNPFCDTCNRVRLTADGKLRNCLFAQTEMDLLTPFRKGEDIVPLIESSVLAKHFKRGGLPDFTTEELFQKLSKRKMIEIGG